GPPIIRNRRSVIFPTPSNPLDASRCIRKGVSGECVSGGKGSFHHSPVTYSPLTTHQDMKSVDEQLSLIRRGVEQIVPEAELRQKLERSFKTGQPLRVKYGIDPTGIDVHLGHTVPLRKLRLFQELGHQAVLIIGNYTALVGDPSGRDQTRARLTREQVEVNARDYLKQVSKVIDISKT